MRNLAAEIQGESLFIKKLEQMFDKMLAIGDSLFYNEGTMRE